MGNASTLSPTGQAVKWPPLADGLVLALGLALVSVLVRFWGANTEYADRLLVVIVSAGLAWYAREDLAKLPIRPLRLGYLPLAIGAAAFPVGWFLTAQVAPKAVVIWWLALAWLGMATGMILLRGGWAHLRRLAFPLAFVLFALPIPNRILVPLQDVLQRATTSAAAAVLPLLGSPVERNGFILSLPSGDLGVAEACSGVKSVTALTAIAAFVAHHSGFGLLRGLLLLTLSVPVIAAVNAVRVILSGLIQEHIGPAYIQGQWHEALGFAMVLLGLGLIVMLAERMKGKRAETAKPDDVAPPPNSVAATRSGARALPAAILLSLCVFATVAAQFAGMGAERELVATAPLADIPKQLGPWKGEDLPVPEFVTEMLTYDAVLHRMYTRDLGFQTNVWVIFWSSQSMVKGYHHPDVCLPKRGSKLRTREITPVDLGGSPLPLTVRDLEMNKTSRQLVLYWTQEGRRVWTEEDERSVYLSGDSHNWLSERLFRRTTPEATGRIVVLIGTETWGDGVAIRNQTFEFAKLIASAVYDLCPWADIRQPK